jgi:hypothetical protein
METAMVNKLLKDCFRDTLPIRKMLTECANVLFAEFPRATEILLKAFFEAYAVAFQVNQKFPIDAMLNELLVAPHLNTYFRSRERANELLMMMGTTKIMSMMPLVYLRYTSDFLRGCFQSTLDLNKSYFFESEIKIALKLALEKLYEDFGLRAAPSSLQDEMAKLSELPVFVTWNQQCFSRGLGVLDKHWPLPQRDVLATMTHMKTNRHYYVFQNTFNDERFIRTTLDALSVKLDKCNYSLPDQLQLAGNILSNEQRSAIDAILRLKFGIIIGFPGVGKTTILACIYDMEHETGLEETLFLCPFNKAKVRAINLGIKNAITADSFISLGKWNRGKLQQRYASVHRIIVDESSVLSARVLAEILTTCEILIEFKELSLILVGDPDQLPPVQSGSVFIDLIGAFPGRVYRLKQVHRTNAKQLLNLYKSMRNGLARVGVYDPEDTSLVVCQDEEKALEQYQFDDSCVVIAYTNKLVKRFNDCLREKHIQCLNERREFTPLPLRHFGKNFFKQEKLIATTNCQYCEVFKGMTGIIQDKVSLKVAGTCPNAQRILVYVDGCKTAVVTCVNAWSSGYAITSHKSQGSEWKTVIAAYPFFMKSIPQQSVYTAATRGKNQLILLTNNQAWGKLCANKVDLANGTLLKIIYEMQIS